MLPIIQNIMIDLASKRPVFHSEADFQHAFAWELHQVMPESLIRLEYRPDRDERLYLDLWLRLKNAGYVAIELKYKTRMMEIELQNERYTLKNHSAQDCNRYYFLKDIERLERIINKSVETVQGFAIMLTNDHTYWLPSESGTIDEQFLIHEGRNVSGALCWSGDAGEGTTKGKEAPIVLNNEYLFHWRSYSNFSERKYGDFRYLCVPIKADSFLLEHGGKV